MDEILVREKLRAYVTEGEPPLTLTSAALLAQGSRRRMLRLGAGTALATVSVAAAFLIGVPGDRQQPAALSSEAACLARVPIVAVPTPDITADPLAATSPLSPADSGTATRVSCYLVDTVMAMLPETRYLPVGWRVEAPFQTFSSNRGLTAGARTPAGSFGVAISPATASPSATAPHGTVRRLPNGVEVVVDVEDDYVGPGSKIITVVRRTAGTVVTVAAANVSALWPDPVYGGPPILTTEQLIQIATAPQLAIYG